MPELSDGYHATRERIAELVRDLTADDLARPVPACPAWVASDLLAHLVGIPESLSSGDYPSGDLQAWLDRLVDERRQVPPSELLERWEACAVATSAVIDGTGAQLFIDVVSHEHDLRGAVGRPGARGVPEVRATVQLLLDLLAPEIAAAGLGSLVVDSGEVTWASQFTRPGCTLKADPWEAIRVLQSRRTAGELRALPHSGDIEPYLAVFDAHSPLPTASLQEA